MNTIDRVVLGELDPIATLVGEPSHSTVVQSGGRSLLSGRFALRVSTGQTDFLTIDPFEAVVTRQLDRWVLISIRRAVFAFPRLLVIQPEPQGPWLAAERASLQLAESAGSPLLLSLDEASLSLVPDAAPAAGRRFFFPTRTGTGLTQLLPIAAGSDPIFGFFVAALKDGGFGVLFGGLADGAAINPHGAVTAFVPGDTFLEFRLPLLSATASVPATSISRLMFDGSDSLFGLHVAVPAEAAIGLNEPLENMTALRAATFVAGDGWFSAPAMHEASGDVRIKRLHQEPGDDDTQLVAPPRRVAFHMSLAHQSGGAIHREHPQFVYRDDAITNPTSPLTPRDRYYGLRLRGLSGDGGVQARLDATAARVFLDVTGRFEYAAGEDFEVRGESVVSLLVPKPDSQDPSTRSLVIPAAVAQLQCRAPIIPSSSDRPMDLDTSRHAGELLLLGPDVHLPPAGTVGTDVPTNGALVERPFTRWALSLDQHLPSLDFHVNDRGVFPVLGQRWPTVFGGSTAAFALLEHPGGRVTLNPGVSRTQLAASETRLTVVTHTDGKEILVYTAFVAILALKDKIVDYVLSSIEASVNDPAVRFELENLDDRKLFPNREAESLIAVFCDEPPGGRGDAEIDKFIRLHRTAGKTRLVWPFATGLAALLWDETEGPFTAISRRRDPHRRPGMALDYSSRDGVDFESFGWSPTDVEEFKKEPLLWPRLSGRTAAQLDPYDPFWRGVLLRDVPLVIPVDPNLINTFTPFLKSFYATLNDNLLLEYGWKDETGATWRGGFVSAAGLSLAPNDAWRDILDLRLTRFVTRGSAGRIIGADGGIVVALPQIKRKNGQPVGFSGVFGLSTTNGLRLERIEFAVDVDAETDSIPGFEKVRVRRFSTDLQTLRIDIELTASARLVVALPFLADGQRLNLSAVVPLSGGKPAGWTFTIEREIHTNLFGRFPTTIQSLTLTFGAQNALDMNVRIHLGIAGLASIGARIKLFNVKDTWTFDVELDHISAEIGIGSFRIAGALGWSTEHEDHGPIEAGTIDAGAGRDFWGDITLETGGLVDGSLLLRIGNKGEVSYWIGALQGPDLNFGSAAKLRKPALLIAHHVDFKEGDKNLAALLANAQASIASAVRPPDTGAGRTWIAEKWRASGEVGTLVAASGFLQVHDQVASAPDGSAEGDFTCLAVNDTGLFRAEATVMFMKAARAHFGLAVDLPNKQFSAAIQLPEFRYGAFTVHAGQIGFGLGWGGKPFFLASVGWPTPIKGDVMNRDWSKSVMLRWDGAFPINTFWGGMKTEIKDGGLFLGFAFRAGWTWEYSVSVLGLAKGSASLGLAVGGTVEIFFGLNDQIAAPATFVPTRALLRAARDARRPLRRYAGAALEDEALAHMLQFALPRIDAHVTAMNSVSVTARVIYYADVWGKASAELLGVTIASIDIGAHAAFLGCIALLPSFKIVQLKAEVGFHLSIRIGCVEFGASASIDISLINLGPCPHLDAAPAALFMEPRKALA